MFDFAAPPNPVWAKPWRWPFDWVMPDFVALPMSVLSLLASALSQMLWILLLLGLWIVCGPDAIGSWQDSCRWHCCKVLQADHKMMIAEAIDTHPRDDRRCCVLMTL